MSASGSQDAPGKYFKIRGISFLFAWLVSAFCVVSTLQYKCFFVLLGGRDTFEKAEELLCSGWSVLSCQESWGCLPKQQDSESPKASIHTETPPKCCGVTL